MLYVYDSSGKTLRSWNWDENITRLSVNGISSLPYVKINDIGSLSCSKTELDIIRHNFTNIPMLNSFEVEWYGDMARFIYANLCNKFGVY